MIKTLGNNIVNAFTGGNPVKAIYAYGQLVWPVTIESSYYIKWTPSSAEGQFNIDGTTYDLSTFSGLYYWSTGIINRDAFNNNKSIQSIETNAKRILDSAFESCTSLTQVNLPMCSYIGDYVFSSCSSLSQVSLPMCEYIGIYAFKVCTSLSQVILPVCSYIDYGAFMACYSLTNINLPVCSYIESQAFAHCDSLSQIDLPMCSYLGNWALSGSTIILRYDGVVTAGGSFPIGGNPSTKVYVPASLVDAYKSAENWSVFSDQIFPIPS